jgi:alkylation response protein AidB-like acyl-CoA dehydrogenase
MDFQLTEDQRALQEGIRSFCEGRVSLDTLRELEEKEGLDRGLWAEFAEMGVFSLRLPESKGGVGLGFADAVLVFAELGRCLAPGPLVWTHLLADRIEGAFSGETVVGGLDGAGCSATPIVVEHLAALDVLVALRPDGVYRIDPRSLDARAIATPLDPHTPVHELASLPQGERIADADTALALRVQGAALTSALMLGIAEMTQILATAYAKERKQFNRPVGSFQALKHILADMFVRQELARAAVYAAGATLDDPQVGSPARAAAAAKLVAGEAAMKNARACIQVHGGMGYTWEIPAHYYLKRTWVHENVFGTVDEQAEQMAEWVASQA